MVLIFTESRSIRSLILHQPGHEVDRIFVESYGGLCLLPFFKRSAALGVPPRLSDDTTSTVVMHRTRHCHIELQLWITSSGIFIYYEYLYRIKAEQSPTPPKNDRRASL